MRITGWGHDQFWISKKYAAKALHTSCIKIALYYCHLRWNVGAVRWLAYFARLLPDNHIDAFWLAGRISMLFFLSNGTYWFVFMKLFKGFVMCGRTSLNCPVCPVKISHATHFTLYVTCIKVFAQWHFCSKFHPNLYKSSHGNFWGISRSRNIKELELICCQIALFFSQNWINFEKPS